jgi:hypothetical protein
MNATDGALIFGGATLLLLALTLLLGIETYLLARGRKPITTYTRAAVEDWPGPSLTVVGVFLFVVGALSAHFVWDATCG